MLTITNRFLPKPKPVGESSAVVWEYCSTNAEQVSSRRDQLEVRGATEVVDFEEEVHLEAGEHHLEVHPEEAAASVEALQEEAAALVGEPHAEEVALVVVAASEVEAEVRLYLSSACDKDIHYMDEAFGRYPMERSMGKESVDDLQTIMTAVRYESHHSFGSSGSGYAVQERNSSYSTSCSGL